MKKINFLSKLAKEGKLSKVEPSEEIKKAYLQKADKSLISAKTLYKIENLEDSVSMAYYSMYHSLLALLFSVGIRCENHAGAIILLKEIFDIDNNVIFEAKTQRVDKQYYVDFSITKEDTNELIEKAEEFKSTIKDFISKLNNEKINQYRNKFDYISNRT